MEYSIRLTTFPPGNDNTILYWDVVLPPYYLRTLRFDLYRPDWVKKGDNTRKSAELFINSINRVLYGSIDTEEQWNAIFGALKKIRPKLPDILQEQFPSLNEQEFRICLLTYAGFSISEIALIMNLKPNTIQTRRTSIRRKIGVKSNESTIEFLNKKLD